MCGRCPKAGVSQGLTHSCASLSSVTSLFCFQRGKRAVIVTLRVVAESSGSLRSFCLSRPQKGLGLCALGSQSRALYVGPGLKRTLGDRVCLKRYTWKGLVSEVSGGCRCIFSSLLSGHTLSRTPVPCPPLSPPPCRAPPSRVTQRTCQVWVCTTGDRSYCLREVS